MSKPYTEDDLQQQLTRDLTWRIREISDLKTAAKDADPIGRSVLLRALVTICYAHWEGHVRFSAQKFMQHVSLKGLRFEQLSSQFVRNYFLPRILAISNKTSVSERGKLVDEILSAHNKKFTRVNVDLINTKSNLSFDVLSEICTVCGLNGQEFADKQSFIDIILLRRRNGIAHGEDTFVEAGELDNIVDETIGLMRAFSNLVQNNAVLGEYRNAENAPPGAA